MARPIASSCLAAPLQFLSLLLILAFCSNGPLASAEVSSLEMTGEGRGTALSSNESSEDHSQVLDPILNRYFIVSFIVKFERLPREGRRTLLVAKTEKGRRATKGWALVLSAYRTSVRPEVYWRGNSMVGSGWLTFENVDLRPKTFYAITLVARPKGFVSLYYQELSQPVANSAAAEVKYLGGVDVSNSGVPLTRGKLALGSNRKSSSVLHGEISDLLIAVPESLKEGVPAMISFLDGGPRALADKLSPEEISLRRN